MPGVPGFGSLPGLGFAIPGMDIIANIKETVTKAAERAASKVKPGTAWGSCNVPTTRKYELPDKMKPKVKEETKKAAK